MYIVLVLGFTGYMYFANRLIEPFTGRLTG